MKRERGRGSEDVLEYTVMWSPARPLGPQCPNGRIPFLHPPGQLAPRVSTKDVLHDDLEAEKGSWPAPRSTVKVARQQGLPGAQGVNTLALDTARSKQPGTWRSVYLQWEPQSRPSCDRTVLDEDKLAEMGSYSEMVGRVGGASGTDPRSVRKCCWSLQVSHPGCVHRLYCTLYTYNVHCIHITLKFTLYTAHCTVHCTLHQSNKRT